MMVWLGLIAAPLHVDAMLDTSPASVKARTRNLLAWYDRQGRDLPWRVKGGKGDPYRVWLSEIMLQQTTVEAVKPYFAKFLALWPDVKALASAEEQAVLAAWAGLGYYARARNLMACARVVTREFDGIFPQTEAELRALPGIGVYTAAAIAAIAFGQRAIVIDGNIERVITRLEVMDTPLPQAKAEIRAALETIVPADRPGDFAQALMDLGATICRPKSPSCLVCPLNESCIARARGNATDFPVKPAKKGKKALQSLAFVVLDAQGRILLRSRPDKGLLARMAEVPNSEWSRESDGFEAQPLQADWKRLNQPVIHIFTHIELRMDVAVARLDRAIPAPVGMRWVSPNRLDQEPLPTLFHKVIELGLRALN
ncbi:MAG: A/G-specific adenine glycosylase [Rhabdaerophilum sp.]